MRYGFIVIGCGVTLTIMDIRFHGGEIRITAEGLVVGQFPTGDVPVTIYGDDDKVVGVTHGDIMGIIGFKPHPGDTIQAYLDLKIESMKGLSPRTIPVVSTAR